MSQVHRSALVPRPASLLYALVLDVDAYPRRFAWCESAQVLEQDASTQLARLSLRVAGLRVAFTTRNRLTPDERIELALVDGPFTALRGAWSFRALGAQGCKVALDLDFEMSGRLVGNALASGFAGLADRLVDDFVREALAA